MSSTKHQVLHNMPSFAFFCALAMLFRFLEVITVVLEVLIPTAILIAVFFMPPFIGGWVGNNLFYLLDLIFLLIAPFIDTISSFVYGKISFSRIFHGIYIGFNKARGKPEKERSTIVDKDREISEQNIWVCSHCGTTNAIYLANCKNCGKNLDLEDDNSEDTTSEIIDDGQKWYYALSGERKGPVSKNTLINLYKHETIFLTTKVWNSNMPDWVELKQTGLISELNVPPPLHGSDVNNTLVWIVAFVPLLDIFLPLQNLSTVAQFLLFALINSILCIIDERQIKKSGHNPDEINLLFFAALLVPVYLFRRANILKQKYTYAITWCVSLIVSIFLRAALESGGYGNGDVGFFAVLTVFFILALIALVVFVEIKIGKAVGSMLSKETGLILGIILIVLGITLFIGIPVIIYSNKKKDGLDLPTANININPTTGKTNENGGSLLKFVGKNYKDILLENNLDEYVALFTENKLTDISIISGLTDSDFEKIGVTILGDRKRILKIFSTI